jgi:hypothetical protein
MMLTEQQLTQRTNALHSANRVRTRRAEIKRDLASGDLLLAELLEDPPREVLKATIGEVLEWMPGIGHWRAKRILAPGTGAPGVGRDLAIGHLSPASKRRIVMRYEEIRPWRYAEQHAAAA